MREEAWEDLLKRLARATDQEPRITSAMVELTYGCNLRCVHCYNPTHQARGELTTEQMFKLLEDLKEAGCLRIGFTGGELFTRRDAMKILRHAKRLGFVINLHTNATLVTREIAAGLREIDPYLVEVSIYGATAKTYESVTGVPGSFAKFCQGVDLLTGQSIAVLLKIPLMTLNAHELEEMKEFARLRSLRYQFSTKIHPRVDGSLEPLAVRLPANQAFQIWRREVGESWRNSAEGKKWMEGHEAEEEGCGRGEGLFPCACGKSNVVITPHGRMNLCLFVYEPRYDLTKGPLNEGWKELVRMVAQAKPTARYQCADCPLTKVCDRGMGDGWLAHKVFDAPCLPHFREVAEQKADFFGIERGVQKEEEQL